MHSPLKLNTEKNITPNSFILQVICVLEVKKVEVFIMNSYMKKVNH